MNIATSRAYPTLPSLQPLLSWRNLAVVLLALAVAGGFLAGREILDQREELQILARHLATTTESRDALIVEREQLTSDRDATRLRAAEADSQAADLQIQLSDTKSTVTRLSAELNNEHSEVARLEQESTALRAKVQAAQSDARDQARAADAASSAQRRAQGVADAFADVNTASSNLSRTRDRMINVLLDQISAERAGRTTTARSLAGEYNSLLATHNRQVTDYNAALGKLRAFLP